MKSFRHSTPRHSARRRGHLKTAPAAALPGRPPTGSTRIAPTPRNADEETTRALSPRRKSDRRSSSDNAPARHRSGAPPVTPTPPPRPPRPCLTSGAAARSRAPHGERVEGAVVLDGERVEGTVVLDGERVEDGAVVARVAREAVARARRVVAAPAVRARRDELVLAHGRVGVLASVAARGDLLHRDAGRRRRELEEVDPARAAVRAVPRDVPVERDAEAVLLRGRAARRVGAPDARDREEVGRT